MAKIRKGFVSNSSSSSFVCDICGNAESGYDASAADCGMAQCEYGHTVCFSHILNPTNEQLEKFADRVLTGDLKEYLNSDFSIENCDDEICQREAIKEAASKCFTSYEFSQSDMEDLCGLYELPSEFCPLCSLSVITDDDILAYVIKENNSTKKFIVDKIHAQFGSDFDAFKAHIKGVK